MAELDTGTKATRVVATIGTAATVLGQAGFVAIPVVGPIVTVTALVASVLPSFFRKKPKIQVPIDPRGVE